jgi:hypothetical protein
MQCPALVDWSVDDDPSRSVIACEFHAAHASIDPCVFQPRSETWAEQEMIEAHPSVARGRLWVPYTPQECWTLHSVRVVGHLGPN